MGCGRGIRGRIYFQRKTAKGLIDGHKLSFFFRPWREVNYSMAAALWHGTRFGRSAGGWRIRSGCRAKAIPRSLG